MSLYVGMDYTPIEEYDTTLEQRWSALSHTAGRVAPEDMLEMQAIFGLVSILPSDYYSPPLCRWKHRLTADNVGRHQNGHTYCLECGRQRRIAASKAKCA
jgi:hypothetical protein